MTFTAELRRRAAAHPRRIAFPEWWDPRVLDAAALLAGEGIVKPVIVGDRPTIEGRLRERDAGDGVEILDVEGSADEILGETAGLLVAGAVDGVVAGADLPTAQVVRSALKQVGLRDGVRTLSSSFYMEVAPFRGREAEVLTFTDAGVVPEPTAAQLAEIAFEAARARRLVVGDEPRVAFLSFSTRGSAAGPSVERVREALSRFREMAPEVAADGELQGDAALIPEVAERKASGSTVAGRANVLVFPDLDAGNIAYKLVQRLARATALGPILQGLRRPMNDLSRGASVDDVVDVAAITALMSSA